MTRIRTNPTPNQAAHVDSFVELPVNRTTVEALSRTGITTPTPIQAVTLPQLLAGRDVIAQARTGSGKTLAFVIPALERIDPRQPSVQVLVLTPTRELAVQISQVFEQIIAGRPISVVSIFGGRAVGPQVAALRQGAQIVVGAPGRVLDLLNRGELTLHGVRFLVLDEADEMLDRGFAPDVERILARTPRDRQTALFSATVPEWVQETADKHLRNPLVLAIDRSPEDAPPIAHVAYDVPQGDKLAALRELLDARGDGSTIVFGRTKHGVKKLARQLERDGYPVGALQGNLSQNARDLVMRRFREGDLQILVATNVAARGLDISSVDQVINLELPESPELLTHRIGRTGRMGRTGRAITLLGPDDGPKWRALERASGRHIPREVWQGAAATLDAGSSVAPAERQPIQEHDGHRSRPAAPKAPRRTVDEARPSRRSNGNGAATATTVVWADGRPLGSTRAARPAASATVSSAIVCSTCGSPAEVPFSPDPSRPVYCSDCHRARSQRRAYGTRRR